MGLMDKFKNLFTEEVEEEVRPIKKEVRHVEIPSPKRSETIKTSDVNNISDSSVITKDEKIITPVYFDDKDFDDLEKPKPKPKERIKETPALKREDTTKLYGGKKVEEKRIEPVTFKPSPIISPVYGVLDKNYFKDEVSTRKTSDREIISRRSSSDKVTIDDIRNKAYGTLEDDLKNSLFDNSYDDISEKYDDGAIDVLEELNFDEIDMDENIKLTNEKVNSLLLDDLDLDDDTELLAMQLEEQNRKLEEINQLIDDEETESNKDEVLESIEPVETKKIEEQPTEKVDLEEKKTEKVELEEKTLEELVDEKRDEIEEVKIEPKSSSKTKEEPKKRSSKKVSESESLTDSELFDLVDSMYDEKGE